MLRRIVLTVALWTVPAAPLAAQGLVSDLLAGKLVAPETGQWSLYEITDQFGENRYLLRQAIVGQEGAGGNSAYWVEFEITPETGFPVIYKMLLQGPASDPENIKRILVKEGPEPVHEQPVPEPSEEEKEDKPKTKRTSLGEERVEIPGGVIEAEHYRVRRGERRFDVWINEDIRPSGIVRLVSPEGEMVLRGHGKGGEQAESRIDRARDNEERLRLETGVVPKQEDEE
jgi:hypothetical protein